MKPDTVPPLHGPCRLLVGAMRDAGGLDLRPAAAVIQAGTLRWCGCPQAMPEPWREVPVVMQDPTALVLPGFVNAHAHLELSSLAPRPCPGDFLQWVRDLRAEIAQSITGGDAQAFFVDAALHGATLTQQAGVVLVGDITSNHAVIAALAGAGLAGVSYLECFGLGAPHDAATLARIGELAPPPVHMGPRTIGLQPHAPYSAGPALYETAATSGHPVCTHLAETTDEATFVATATGPMRDYLMALGRWEDRFARSYDDGLSPVQWMASWLAKCPWLLAHCNHVSDADIALLAATGASVAYCPVASAYFGHSGHRYRDMLAAGVNVSLGTDALRCQPPDAPDPLGIWPAMRFLHERDATDPALLLAMATVNGARALSADPATVTFAPGAPARFNAVTFDPANPADALAQALRHGPSRFMDFTLGGRSHSTGS